MIELTANNKLVILPSDAQISIEKSSPVLNDKVGSFSYPFPVPTEKNKKTLGHPGRLERVGNIAAKNFILKDDGVQVLRGEIDFDPITTPETGLVLQSGNTEFSKKMDKKKLGDLDYGSEFFPNVYDQQQGIDILLDNWNDANKNDNGKYVCFPMKSTATGTWTEIFINRVHGIESDLYNEILGTGSYLWFCMQFKLNFILENIFKSAGYYISENQVPGSLLNDILILGKTIKIRVYHDGSQYVVFSPYRRRLEYSEMMPDLKILDFIEYIKGIAGLTIDIHKNKRQVSIYFNKEIFLANNVISKHNNSEVTGFEHNEIVPPDGFQLGFSDQDNELDTKHDYEIDDTVDSYDDLPAHTSGNEELIYHVSLTERDYQLLKKDDSWQWQQIGRLKPYISGDGEKEFTIDAIVPPNIHHTSEGESVEMPYLSSAINTADTFCNIPFSIILNRGRLVTGTITWPYLVADTYSLDGVINFVSSLKPAYMYENFHKDFINWQTYRAREVTKYLKLSLAEVVSLQWRKRYVISGIPILLNKINFELPYRGIVKINGFTS